LVAPGAGKKPNTTGTPTALGSSPAMSRIAGSPGLGWTDLTTGSELRSCIFGARMNFFAASWYSPYRHTAVFRGERP